MRTELIAPLQARLRSTLQEQLAPPLGLLFEELDSRLFTLAERSRVAHQQHLYFDGLRQLRRARADVEADFLQRIVRALQPGADAPALRPSRSPLSLIDKDEQSETLHLQGQTQRLSERLAPALDALLTRLHALHHQPAPTDSQAHTLSPPGMARAFRLAMNAADVDVEVRLLTFDLFAQHVLGKLETVYAKLNALLVEHGVLPQLSDRLAPARSAPPPRRSAPRPLPESNAARAPLSPATSQPDGNDVRMHEVQQLMQARQQHYPPSGMASGMPPGMASALPGNLPPHAMPQSFDHGYSASLPAPVLDAALDRLSSYSGDPLSFKEHLLHSAQELGFTGPARLSSENEAIIDFIGLLFSRINNDSNLSRPLQSLISRLHLPLLRGALKDPSLLQAPSHPAREFIDGLGQLAVGWCPSADPGETLLKQIIPIIEQMSNQLQAGNLQAFEQARADLRQCLEPSRRRASLAEQRSIDAAIGRDRLARAHSRVASLLQERLHEQDLMPWVRQLLRGPWANHLALQWLRYGEESPAFQEALAFVDELLWADDPDTARSDPARLALACQALPAQLRKGLSGVTLHDSDIASLATRLETFLASQIQNGEPPGFLYENDPILAQADFATQWQDSLTVDQPLPGNINPALFEQVRNLPPGTWFELRSTPESEGERAKLCWKSEYTGNNLFVNRNGVKVQELPPNTLAAQMEAGLAQLIDSHRLMERTLCGLIEQLRQYASSASAPVPDTEAASSKR